MPIPRDCLDGFTGSFWARPEAYLDPAERAGMSSFNSVRPEEYADGLARLAGDLAGGEWDRRYAHLRARDSYDIGYRLVVAEI